jgi:hypothetical protein
MKKWWEIPPKKFGNSDEIFGGISLQKNHGPIFGGPMKGIIFYCLNKRNSKSHEKSLR